MTRWAIPRSAAGAVVLGLAGCQPAPRAASWFEAHPQETAAVVTACARGNHRGTECENARAAEAALRAKALQDLFRRGFE